MDGLEWLDEIACADLTPEVAFQSAGQKPHPELVAACGRCPVREQCLEYALTRPVEHGYVGGLSASQRRLRTN